MSLSKREGAVMKSSYNHSKVLYTEKPDECIR